MTGRKQHKHAYSSLHFLLADSELLLSVQPENDKLTIPIIPTGVVATVSSAVYPIISKSLNLASSTPQGHERITRSLVFVSSYFLRK